MTKKIEEMNEQELAAVKKANPSIKLTSDSASTENNVMIKPDLQEVASFKPAELDENIKSVYTKEDIDNKQKELSKTSLPDSEQRQKLNEHITEGRVKAVAPTPTKQKSDYLLRREEGAARAQKAYNDFVETYGRKPTEEEAANVIGKDLYSWQFINNKAGNIGDAFGRREFFGQVHGKTMEGLDKNYQAWKREQQAKSAEESKKPMAGMVKIQDGLDTKDVYITKDNQRTAKLIGNQIADPNNIPPEVANRYRTLFEEMGVPVGKEFTEYTTLGDIIQGVDDDVLDMLGFYDEETGSLKVPHQETYEEMLARREKAEEALRLQTEQRALDRQRARTGLADLAAGIGDMIKASNGAIVTPRDYQAMYNSLTEQQKTNYNNYLARMQAMKEAEKAKAKEAADRAYQEKLLAEQRAYQEEQTRKAQDFQARESALNRQSQENMLGDRLENQRLIQSMKNENAIAKMLMSIQSKEALNSARYGDSITFEGSVTPIKSNMSDGLYQGIYGYIEPAIRNHPAFVNALASIDKAYLETNPDAVRVIVSNALSNPTVPITDEMKVAIRKLINDAKESSSTPVSQKVTIPEEADLVKQAGSTTTPKKEESAEDIVKGWWKS